MDSPLDVSRLGAVEIWTINRPESGNAITGSDFADRFERAVDEANADTEVRAVILTGEGKIFTAGGNVKEMADGEGIFGEDPQVQRQAYQTTIQRLPRAAMRLEVPIIAAVNGAAVGAGCDLAMMCDMRIASEKASFAESFVQVGLIPGDGGSWFLRQVVGHARAAEMTFTGDRVDAATALEWGMVSQVVAPEDLLTAAHALADRVAKNPPHPLRMAKRLLNESRTASLDTVLSMAAAMQPLAHMDPEHHARVAKWRTT
jgi:enoyl-CoA hydratase/carnithine racemase